MPVVVSGHLATSVFSVAERNKFSPQPVTGTHAKTLAEMSKVTDALVKVVELERTGVCDGAGFWINRDPILNAARRLLVLTEQRSAERQSCPKWLC